MPIPARRWLRRMRGGAQAQLIEAANGSHYVVKSIDNPQHRRILANEWISAVFLRYLQIQTPETALIEISPEFLAEFPECAVETGTKRIAWTPGWHFGSLYPGDPGRIAIYDFLPDVILPRVANEADFRAVICFDKWTANADARQCIFYRAETREPWERGAGRAVYVASMIDNGYSFDGPNWKFPDAPLGGLYHRHAVYASVRGPGDFEPWLSRVRTFPEEVVDRALREIPPAWIEGDREALEAMLERLMRRRRRIADLIADTRATSRSNPFPNWT
ncbi:MAG: HipA family kinase [Bryobacteraceae bacterium]